MSAGEMLAWTKRLNEIRNIKDPHLQRQRMRNMMNDFREAYREQLQISNDRILMTLFRTLDHEHFLIV